MLHYLFSMNILYDIVLGLILIFVIGDAIYEFIKSSGTTWERLLAVGKESATILWSRALIFVGVALDFAAQGADFLGAPGVASALNQYLDSKTLGTIMIGIAFVNEAARRRTLQKREEQK